MQQDTANVAVTIKMSLENAKVCIKFTLLYNINNTKWLGLTAISCIPYVFLIIILFSIFWGQLFNYKRQRNDIFHCLICHQKLWHQMSLCLKTSRSLRWKVHLVDLPIYSNWKDPRFPPSSYWKFLKILKNAYNFFIIRLNNILGWRVTFANIKVKDQSHSKIILISFVSLLLRVSELQTLHS